MNALIAVGVVINTDDKIHEMSSRLLSAADSGKEITDGLVGQVLTDMMTEGLAQDKPITITPQLPKEELAMQTDYSKMTEQEALEILRRDWPEYDRATDMKLSEGKSMVEWLGVLESFA